jgi:hypothetical protein
MKTLAITAAIIAAIAAPSLSLAADDTVKMTTIVCRPATAGETPNATMGGTVLTCHKVNMTKIKSAITKIRANEAKTDADYRAAVEMVLQEETFQQTGD